MNPLLVVLNPRRIPDCIRSISSLQIDRLWMQGFTRTQVQYELPPALELDLVEYDPIVFLADDTAPEQSALDAVLDLYAEVNRDRAVRGESPAVVTGFCNLDLESALVNITRRPFTNTRKSTVESYDFFSRRELEEAEEPVRTWFGGMCLTAIPRSVYDRFPYRGLPGRPSDFDLCCRLQTAGIPIYAPPGGFVLHVKERWNMPDQAPEKQLLVGKIPAEARFDPAG